MMRLTWIRTPRAAAAGALVLLGAAAMPDAAGAQTVDPGRAFRGLFAQAAAESALTLSADVYQGFDWPRGVGVAERDTFTGVAPVLLFTHAGRRTTFGASGNSVLRYSQVTGELRNVYHAGGIGLRRQFGRAALELEQSLSRLPSRDLAAMPALGGPGLGMGDDYNVDQAAADERIITASSHATLGGQIGRYLWMSGGYRYTYWQASAPGAGTPQATTLMHAHDLTLRMARQVGRYTGVRFDLVSSKGRPQRALDEPPAAWIHNFNVGVDRFRNISLTRTTTVSLTGGTGMVNDLEGQRFVLLGSAGIEKRMGRATRASLQVRRDLSFVEGVAEPVLAQTVNLRLEAAAGRRWTFAAHGVYGRGRAASADEGPLGFEYEAYTAEARAAFRVSGPVSLYADYFRAHRSFGLDVTAPFTRNGVRVGLIIHMPVFGERGVE